VASVRLRGVTKAFGNVQVLHGVDLDVAEREFVVFVGPSGCGKSTLLRIIAGLEQPTGGTVEIDGRDVTRVDPADRGVSMVFQSYALYPHLTVAENMGFSLQLRKRPKEEINTRVREVARILQIEHLLDRKPSQLSGGQRQRVAIGRAIVRKPSVFLFDEPLSNLDAALRMDMRMELAKLHRDLGATMIYVTHDQVEAMTLADRIVVLNGGVVQQVGAPIELYNNPANAFVAGFIGSPKMNFLPVTVESIEGDEALISAPSFGRVAVPKGHVKATGKAIMGLRPQVVLAGNTADAAGTFDGRVRIVERMGAETVISLNLNDDASLTAVFPGDRPFQLDQTMQFGFRAADVKLFPADN